MVSCWAGEGREGGREGGCGRAAGSVLYCYFLVSASSSPAVASSSPSHTLTPHFVPVIRLACESPCLSIILFFPFDLSLSLSLSLPPTHSFFFVSVSLLAFSLSFSLLTLPLSLFFSLALLILIQVFPRKCIRALQSNTLNIKTSTDHLLHSLPLFLPSFLQSLSDARIALRHAFPPFPPSLPPL